LGSMKKKLTLTTAEQICQLLEDVCHYKYRLAGMRFWSTAIWQNKLECLSNN
jgi:hypothetical protein